MGPLSNDRIIFHLYRYRFSTFMKNPVTNNLLILFFGKVFVCFRAYFQPAIYSLICLSKGKNGTF